VLIGPFLTVSAVWTIADIVNGLMAFPNMIAIFSLSGIVVKETKDFFKRQFEINPAFSHKNTDLQSLDF